LHMSKKAKVYLTWQKIRCFFRWRSIQESSQMKEVKFQEKNCLQMIKFEFSLMKMLFMANFKASKLCFAIQAILLA
jgi:hypothetical protein